MTRAPGQAHILEAEIERLLAASDLALEGAVPAVLSGAVVREDGALVACAGLELHGPAALLRSVAVAPGRRGEGLGRGVVRAAEAAAARAGARELYLLTETAAPFFARLGYGPVDRAEVPGSVADSPAVSELCPVTAQAMRRQLA